MPHKDCCSWLPKLILSWDTIHLILLTSWTKIKGLQVLLNFHLSCAARPFEQGSAVALLPVLPVVRDTWAITRTGQLRLLSDASQRYSVFTEQCACSLLDVLVLLMTVFSPKPIPALCPVSLTLLCPTVSPSFSALPSDFQHVFSPLWFRWSEGNLLTASSLASWHVQSHPLNPTALPLLCARLPPVLSDQHGEGLCHGTGLFEIASSQRLPWRTSSILHLQRPRPQYLPLSHHSLWLAL